MWGTQSTSGESATFYGISSLFQKVLSVQSRSRNFFRRWSMRQFYPLYCPPLSWQLLRPSTVFYGQVSFSRPFVSDLHTCISGFATAKKAISTRHDIPIFCINVEITTARFDALKKKCAANSGDNKVQVECCVFREILDQKELAKKTAALQGFLDPNPLANPNH